jgi:hypothetical protein
MAVTYTTAAKVWAYLQRPDALGETSRPVQTTVEMFINWAEGEIERVTGGAWRTLTVTNEYHTLNMDTDDPSVQLEYRDITTFASGTDKLEVFNGSTYVEWVATKTEGRASDYWVDYTNGIVYLHAGYPLSVYENGIRVTYRYGKSAVEYDIEQLATIMAAMRVLEADRDLVGSEGRSASGLSTATLDASIMNLKNQIDKKLEELKGEREKKWVIL